MQEDKEYLNNEDIKSAFNPIKDIVVQSYEQIETRYNNRDEIIGVPSGFYDLDNMTAGFQPSDLIVIASRPSMGKTAICCNIVQEVAIRRKKHVAFVNLESTQEQFTQRMLCSEAEIDSNRLRTGHLQTEDWTKLTRAMGMIADAPIHICDVPSLDITKIEKQIRKLAKQYPLSLIVIDYMQLIEIEKQEDRVWGMIEIPKRLKALAKELKVPIIVASQVSRKVEDRINKRPMLADLSESGCIEQVADIVMFIYREDYYDPDNADKRGKAEIIIAKQRHGPVGSIELLFQENITKFKNQTANKTHVF